MKRTTDNTQSDDKSLQSFDDFALIETNDMTAESNGLMSEDNDVTPKENGALS